MTTEFSAIFFKGIMSLSPIAFEAYVSMYCSENLSSDEIKSIVSNLNSIINDKEN